MAARSAATILAELEPLGVRLGLETFRQLLNALGSPERASPAVLVAGTNGKGSVAAYAGAALVGAGLRTGLYTSPHLVDVRERIVVDGNPIAPSELERAVARVREAAEPLVAAGRLPAHPTYFEALTLAAFEHFRAVAVDVAVVEVGLGGRLDEGSLGPVLEAVPIATSLAVGRAFVGRAALVGIDRAARDLRERMHARG